MEIYTEGDTNTYGQLYRAPGGLLDSDNNSNGNGNFKITVHLEAMKRYYIAVSHNSSTGYGDYTLRFKFIKDMLPAYSNPKGAVWINDSYDKDELELSVQKIVYIDNQDSILWGYKLQQSTFINTIKIKARQSIDELIEESILHGFRPLLPISGALGDYYSGMDAVFPLCAGTSKCGRNLRHRNKARSVLYCVCGLCNYR